jgi:hypothetical protein
MDADLSQGIDQVKAVAEAIANAGAAGCTVVDSLLACRIVIAEAESQGIPNKELLDQLGYLSNFHFTFKEGPLSFELTSTPGMPLEFLDNPTGDPAAVFEGATLQIAERAWQGDVSAARSLPGMWRGDISVQLNLALQSQVDQIAWRVVRTLGVIENEFAAYPWWKMAELVRSTAGPVVFVVIEEPRVTYTSHSFSIISLELLQAIAIPVSISARLEAVRTCSAPRLPVEIALPEELVPQPGSMPNSRIEQVLMLKAEACAWAWLSNEVMLSSDKARIEFLGYRRKSFELDGTGYTSGSDKRIYPTYRWATMENSPDRVLAIRQVMSLQDGDTLPTEPDNILTAAEPIYRALRTNEVAAVLEMRQQARNVAIDAARQSADVAQSTARSAATRAIATLGAVASIAVARATAVLSAKDSRDIAVGIAALLIFLAVWAVFIEGPPMRAPLASLEYDFPRIADLLTQKERKDILSMNVLKKAKDDVLKIRIAAPGLYIVTAAIVLIVAHIRFGLTLP